MNDLLPDVTIKTDTEPTIFLNRIQEIVKESTNYKVDHSTQNSQDINGWNWLTIRPTRSSPPKNLILILSTSTAKQSSRLSIKAQAKAWDPDPPTYESYVQTVRAVILPLLMKYNRKHGSRCRLRIQSKAATEPKLPRVSNIIFQDFLNDANKVSLHPDDWDRFYIFVLHAHRVNLKINDFEMKRILWNAGFTEDHASEISNIYLHGRSLFKTDIRWRLLRRLQRIKGIY